MPVLKSHTIQENPTLSQTDLNAGFTLREYNDGIEAERYMISDAVNTHLRTTPIGLQDTGAPYQIPEKFKEHSKIMLEHQLGQVSPEQFENHRICGLFSDITPHTKIATITYSNYYDLLATFYSFPFEYRNESGAIEFKGSSYIYNDFGVIYPLSLALSANPIGASTIAITSDNQILIHRQQEDAHTNPGRLMPSGSGACSWHDYIDIEAKTLQEIIIHGAEWKMRNECKIPESCKSTTKVMGMARVPIGMKPDFYCFTKLGMTYEQLKEAGAKIDETVTASDPDNMSSALGEYIQKQNAEKPGSVSIQLYLESILLAETCR